eukprot:jgi/Ulvmu1/12522/UM090_0009.1
MGERCLTRPAVADEQRACISYAEKDKLEAVTGLGSMTQNLERFCDEMLYHLKAMPVSLDAADTQLQALFATSREASARLLALDAAAAAAAEAAAAAGAAADDLGGRMCTAEAALAVMPAWKAAYEARAATAEDVAARRHDEAMGRCDRLTALMEQQQQRMWERFDELEQAVFKGAEARMKMAEDARKLQHEVAQARDATSATDASITTLRQTTQALDPRIAAIEASQHDTAELVQEHRSRIQEVETQVAQQEQTVEVLERRLETTEGGLDVARGDMEDAARTAEVLADRVSDLEGDTRAQDALEAALEAAKVSDTVTALQDDLEEGLAEVTTQLEEVRVQAEQGPPVLGELQDASASATAAAESAASRITALEARQTEAEAGVAAHRAAADAAAAAAADAGRAAAALGARLDAEARRLQGYADTRVAPLARAAQVEELREVLSAMREELVGDMQVAKEDVKFELMHEKSPQVASLKEFITSQETSLARLSERLTLAEEAAAVAQANALDATAALTTVQAAAATNASGEDALRAAVAGLDNRVHELQALVATARTQALEAAAAADRAVVRSGRAPDDQVQDIVKQAVQAVRRQAASWGVAGDLVLPEHSARSSAARSSRSHPGAVSAADDTESSFAVGFASIHEAAAERGADVAPFSPPPAPTRIPSETSRLHLNAGGAEEEEMGRKDKEVGLMMRPPVDAAADVRGSAAALEAVGKTARPSLAVRLAARASQNGGAVGAAAAGAASVPLAAEEGVEAAASALGAAGAGSACVSSEHAELMRDMALSLMELHQKSKTSQAFADYARSAASDYSLLPAHKTHCKLMRSANAVLGRLLRKRAAHATDFAVTAVALMDMRLCLLERVAALQQGTMASLAAAVEAAGAEAAAARSDAAARLPLDAGMELLAGLHGLVRVLGEALATRLSEEGRSAMKQVFEQKVGAFIGTHGPQLQQAKRSQAAAAANAIAHSGPDTSSAAAARAAEPAQLGAARSTSARRARAGTTAVEAQHVEAAQAIPDGMAQAICRRLPEDVMLQALALKSQRRA